MPSLHGWTLGKRLERDKKGLHKWGGASGKKTDHNRVYIFVPYPGFGPRVQQSISF